MDTSSSTIMLPVVDVNESREDYFADDKNITIIDKKIINENLSSNLGELLSVSAPLHIQNYGANGSVSSVSIRGSAADHTTINWNGIPINSVTLGQADLSTIPVYFTDEISIANGASGSLYGSGTFGGSINLNNIPDWKEKYNINVLAEYGSFNDKRYAMQGMWCNSWFQSKTVIFQNQSLNNFKYTDTYKFGNPLTEQSHNSLDYWGLLQNVFIKLPKNYKIETGFWYQYKIKELPEIMGSYGSSNTLQKDSTMRFYFKASKLFKKSVLNLKSGYINDFMRYTDKENFNDDNYSIDARIKTKRYLSDINYRHYYSNLISFDFGVSYNRLIGEVDNYGKIIKENNFAVFSGLRLKFKKLTTNFTLRKEFVATIDPKTQFSTGLNYTLIPNKLAINSSYSDKFRVPDFNEKYWIPGGNPNLNPEYGWGSDLGIEYTFFNKDSFNNISVNSTIYTSSINNWIQWVPGEGYWYPKSYKKVWARGNESSLNYVFKIKNINISLSIKYTYTKSTNSKTNDINQTLIGNELMYIPNHIVKSSLNMEYKSVNFGVIPVYIGSRHTREDNEERYMMPSYYVTNINLGIKFKIRKYQSVFYLKINNLFDHQYQVIRSYAMPGRSFLAGLKIGINKSNNN